MFDDIGGKIKDFAVVTCVIGIIASIIIAIIMFAKEAIGMGILYLFIGPLLSWIGSFFMYGFGEIVDKICNIEVMIAHNIGRVSEALSTELYENNYSLSKLALKKENITDVWICKQCGEKNAKSNIACNNCGAYKYKNT